jgi:hypothetical protein
MDIKLLLVKKSGEVVEISINPILISDATVIIYKGVHYTYNSFVGGTASALQFGEVNSPVTIDEDVK